MSNRYNYYSIQYDKLFSQKRDKLIVVNCLLEAKVFQQTTHQSFSNTVNFPWVEILLLDTKDGNYSSSDKENQFVNLIAIVCLKGHDNDQNIYIDTFKKIAKKLNWKLYLEEDDDGNEYIEI